MGFGVTGICIIITKPTCSTGSDNVIIVLVCVVIRVYNRYGGRKKPASGYSLMMIMMIVMMKEQLRWQTLQQ